MKLATALLVLLFLTTAASAQRCAASPRRSGQAPTPQYGSVERTKLLDQVHRGTKDQLGSVQRRALLTGARVALPRPAPGHTRHTRR